jgi:hypothetical protein
MRRTDLPAAHGGANVPRMKAVTAGEVNTESARRPRAPFAWIRIEIALLLAALLLAG